MAKKASSISALFSQHESQLLADWWVELQKEGADTDNRISEAELRKQTQEFLSLLQHAARSGNLLDIAQAEWKPVRDFLDEISRSRAIQGFSSAQTATLIFSLKKPLFSLLRKEFGQQSETLVEMIWESTELLDKLGLHTVKAFQQAREDVIHRQNEELLELSTPVVKLWDGILALPMIGTLDSARTLVVMESLLEKIVETGSEIAIIDITGVPTVDTLVAQHLLKTVTAIRLMGAECIISGIRPQIAQTIVHLGIDLQGIMTKANLSDALALALRRCHLAVTKLPS